jgi:hypothetical protein
MPRITKVQDNFRKNDLSFTPGGSTIKVVNIKGETLIYDKIKSPKSYCKKILKLTSFTIDKIYVNDQLYYDRSETN